MLKKILRKYKSYLIYDDSTDYDNLVNISSLLDKIIIFLFPFVILPIIGNLLFGEYKSAIIITCALAGMIVIFVLNRYRLYKYTFFMLYTLFSCMMFVLMIINDGIRDTALLIYPVIIMVTAFVLDLKIFLITTVINFIVLFLIALAEYSGLFEASLSNHVDLEFVFDLVTLMVILNVVAYFMIVIAQSREKKLKESNIMKDRFLKILAHDLRSPFQTLIGSSNLLSEHYGELSEEDKRKIVSQLAKSVKGQYDLLETLLSWGKLQTGMFNVHFLEFNLWRVATEAMKSTTEPASEKGITIENNIEQNFTMRGDEFLFATVIRNLISNSLKYTNEGGRISLSSSDSGKAFMIILEDNGIGMSDEKIQEINNSLAVNSVPGLQGELGHGIGLSMIKEIVRLHHGEFEIQSEPGKGSRFTIRIDKSKV